MRPAIVVFILATAGGVSLGSAEPPVAPAAGSRATPAQNGPAEDSARQSSTAATGPAAVAATAAPAAAAVASPAPKAVDEQAVEKMLRLQGYKPQMLNGEMVYCRRETPLGSHLPTTLKCVTVAEAKLTAEEGRRTTERVQRNQTGCLAVGSARGPATGPANCGN